MNGYANGGSEAARSEVGGDDDSEDDDSNPLEDLEALGEKEEEADRLREDEEGLRHAKELSRQGFEASLRSGHDAPPTALADAAPEATTTEAALVFNHVEEADQMHHVYEDAHIAGRNNAEAPKDGPLKVNGAASVDDTSPRDAALTSESAVLPDMPPVNGGFRAVNEEAAMPSQSV